MSQKCFCDSGLDLVSCCLKKYPSIDVKDDKEFSSSWSKYDLWALERRWVCISLTKMLMEYKGLENENIIIFGAGTCMDLPMDFICEKFSDIVLVDIDNSALEVSKKYIPNEHFNKVSWVNWDITGLMEDRISEYIIDLKSGKIKNIDDALSFFKKISSPEVDIDLPETIKSKMPFGVTISDLMITQIFTPIYQTEIYPHLFKLDCERAKNPFEIDEIYDFIDFINFQHMKLMHRVTKKVEGKILVLADTFMAGQEIDGSISEFTSVIQANPTFLIPSNILMKNIGEWFEKYSIVGSNIINPIKKFGFQKVKMENQMWWWWFFSKVKTYLVLSFVFTPYDKDVEL